MHEPSLLLWETITNNQWQIEQLETWIVTMFRRKGPGRWLSGSSAYCGSVKNWVWAPSILEPGTVEVPVTQLWWGRDKRILGSHWSTSWETWGVPASQSREWPRKTSGINLWPPHARAYMCVSTYVHTHIPHTKKWSKCRNKWRKICHSQGL